MKIKPIKNEKDYKICLKRIESLWAKNTKIALDELDILVTLVEDFERRNFEIFPPDPIEAIKFRMEQLGLKKSDLAVYLGGKNRVSEVLNRKRHLSINMIRALSYGLGIPAESLIGPLEKSTA